MDIEALAVIAGLVTGTSLYVILLVVYELSRNLWR